jgi:FkbM family methyltransferase
VGEPDRQSRRIVRDLRLVHRNRLWFSSDASTGDKLAYFAYLPVSYLRMVTGGSKRVRYLGRDFVFDNVATPLNLQSYPHEITRCILRNLPSPPKVVLDIGGNIGQFSTTLSHFVQLDRLDVFEPNPSILPLLASNLAHLGDTVAIHNAALSDRPEATGVLYFQPGRSAIGSVFEVNAGASESVTEVDIRFVSDPAVLTGVSSYDLVKVDVEGFEIEVIRALGNLSVKHLFIEVSGRSRRRTYSDAELFAAITETLGDFTLLYSSGASVGGVAYELLLEFIGAQVAPTA